ncbi:MAG: glycerate kinase [Lachnospiraceae bacterium]|nr:glycerate kinase [Lachnospiraceae bacterium]
MKVVVAMDSFKGSLTSVEAGNAAGAGIKRVCDAEVVVKPMADGGEGTTEALVEGLGGEFVYVDVTGPMGETVRAKYGILGDKTTAVMEMAAACGLTLIKREDRNPWKATTYGMGEMILHAMERGCREFVIGIGGSATTEGGIGMLKALGYEFLDGRGQPVSEGVYGLEQIASICGEHVPAELKDCHFRIACDVKNPLYGENGAVYVFGPQKGVRAEERQQIDEKLIYFAKKTKEYTGVDNSMQEGAGAAGGLGFAFLSYLPHVELKSGIDLVLDAVCLEDELKDADIVVTGEGCMDRQTAMGKVPVGVAHLAKRYNKKVIAFAGSVKENAGECNEEGIDAFFSIIRGAVTQEEAMLPENAKKNMELSVEQVFRLLSL